MLKEKGASLLDIFLTLILRSNMEYNSFYNPLLDPFIPSITLYWTALIIWVRDFWVDECLTVKIAA